MKKIPLTVLLPEDDETPGAFLRRVMQKHKEWDGVLLLVLYPIEKQLLKSSSDRTSLLEFCKKHKKEIFLATKSKKLQKIATAKNVRTFYKTQQIRHLLEHHSGTEDLLAMFAPEAWQQELRSKLQSIGLLSLPQTRIWLTVTVCIALFFIVFFYLLPSAEVRVWPVQNTITQTANIFLVQPDIEADIPERMRKMDLIPFTVTETLSLTFDDISKQFVGTSAEVPMTVINTSDEEYSFRKGTRFVNQAGMVFRIVSGVIVEPKGKATVLAISDDTDVYGQIIGERGNVPPGIKWEVPGLAPEERKLVYGENVTSGTGGTTTYRSVLQTKDLETARKQLEQELLVEAKRRIQEKRDLLNSAHKNQTIELLDRTRYENTLTRIQYNNFDLSEQFIGEEIRSIPIEGSITYTIYGFEKQYARDLLETEILNHIGKGKQLVEKSINLDSLQYFVISYSDDLTWIKLTVDLSGTEEYILDPFHPAGGKFAAKVRSAVASLTKAEALRIVKNFPEVENVEIEMWPPWTADIPSIGSHILVTPEERL